MALVLETGAGLPNSNSYATEAMADAYAADRGNTTWTDSADDKEAALIRATAAIDAQYRGRFAGWRTNNRDQALEWPRADAYDADDNLIDSDEIPTEIIQATIEAAFRELASPGAMMPDLDRGGDIKRLQAGSVSVEYSASASVRTAFTLIDGILSRLFRNVATGLYGRTVRV